MSVAQILRYILLPIGAYLIGSLAPGYWMGKLKGIDLRTQGSKNIGATNVARILGKKAGIAAFVLDLLKGFLPTFFLAWFAAGRGSVLATQSYFVHGILYGAFAILGHTFPIFLGFRGGKAVATGCGVFLALTPLATLLAGLVWLALFLVFRIVSIASMVASIVLPIAALVIPLSSPSLGSLRSVWPVIVFAAVVAALVIARHHSNIRRLLAGTESKFEKNRL